MHLLLGEESNLLLLLLSLKLCSNSMEQMHVDDIGQSILNKDITEVFFDFISLVQLKPV